MLGYVTRRLNNIGHGIVTAAGFTLAKPTRAFVNWATGGRIYGSLSGPAVNEQSALNYLTIYSCVDLIASTIASLPLITYERKGKNRYRATENPIYDLLQNEFNEETSAISGRETAMAHLLTWGNSYTQIVRNKSGSKVLSLHNIGPDVTTPRRYDNGQLYYEVRERGSLKVIAELPPHEVLHVPGLGFDGVVGYSPVRMAQIAIRTGMRQDSEGYKFISRGIRPPGAIKMAPGKKFKDKQEAIQWRERFDALHTGEDAQNNIMFLEDGSEWVTIGIDPEAAQFLESRKFTRRELCGFYRVPPHMIGDTEASTSWGTGIEEQKNGFVTFCLLRWMAKVEKEKNRKFFGGDRDYYVKHNLEGLLRGSILQRSQALEIQHRRGIISDNEWREIEDLNPVDGGDVRHYQLSEGRIDENGDDMPAEEATVTQPLE